MKVSRRNFIKAAPLTVMAAGLISQNKVSIFAQTGTGNSLFPIPNTTQSDPLCRLTSASLTPYLYTYFSFVSADGGSVNLRLERIEDSRPAAIRSLGEDPAHECLSLKFSGPVRSPLQQDTYAVQHSVFGSFDLLITTMGGNGRRLFYEAIINRMQPG